MTGVYGQCEDCGEEFHSLKQKEEHICLKERQGMTKVLIEVFRGMPLQIDEILQGNSCTWQYLRNYIKQYRNRNDEIK